MPRFALLLILSAFMFATAHTQDIYLTRDGSVTFVSEAPLELITASSDELMGAIDLKNNRFAFKISNQSLKGFNSALQQEHFYENYMEVDKYRFSTFEGKIIETIDPSDKNKQQVRAKGTLSIHGQEQERIINASVQFTNDGIEIESDFEVPLSDHNIRIPTIVYQKIAEIIRVEIRGRLLPQPKNN